tara:strand:- start:547 stop:1020 length:474 start_codon:yes stop_codon:yes gene_type:complete
MNMEICNFSGFIWSPAYSMKKDILNMINNDFPILYYCTYKFNNLKEYEKSILEMYTTDNCSQEGIKKVKMPHFLKNKSLSYIYFKMYIEKPNYRPWDRLSLKAKALKEKIRMKYKTKIKDYVHDIIIHISDNDTQMKNIDKIMKKYKHAITDENYKV